MYRETWTPISKDELKQLGLSRIRFKGSTTKTVQSRTIPNQTATEAALEGKLSNYANNGITNATNYQNTANSLLGNTVSNDWSNLLSNYNNTMSGVTSGYSNLANGVLPSSYAAARQQALNDDLTSTVGNTISNLARRGILNSSVANNALNDISQNASDTLAKNYSSDLATYSNLLNNQATNASNILSNSASAEQNSYYTPSQYMTYANSSYSPASSLYNTMYSGRMGTGSTSSSTSGSDGGASTWQAVGTLGSALLCFAAGTLISTPEGGKRVEDIKVGDKVYSLTDGGKITIEEVINLMPPGFNDIYDVNTTKGNIPCTASQPFVTAKGSMCIDNIDSDTDMITIDGTANLISISQLPPDTVYDFTVSGSGVFFANGLAVEGWE
ncbi:hypothetical protein SOV_22970 [Sporomusa ovata DSM 2662]|uniref:Uncharacterized protein n=1 Tax=Sporomusa ovata TaxID=2378 RepID=A0A0U1L3D3_9FIRM|nr:Hint domain-containing protein [Sporomusa ovata]EQB25613.1 hint domain containing protein [Sporomusa ovata DSM 2662]CQR74170.1 hypothetical protein SpAn4DRAFT_0632 [Sporomusa ovata]